MIIYKKYNQQELDLQYNNRFHVPGFEISLHKWEVLSRLAEKKYPIIKDIPYGDKSRECLDIFPSSKTQSKILVFIHGGYWQKFDKSSFHFIAAAFSRYDITTVLINYPLVPTVSIEQVTESCNKATDWVYKNIDSFNGDPEQIFIAGHSAGAHLTAMLMTLKESQASPAFIKGVCIFSGIYNLIPIQLSNINAVLQMNKEAALKNSPSIMKPNQICPLIIVVGSDETNEFKDQSIELYDKWKNNHSTLELIEIPGLNHFSILDSIDDTNSLLHQSICRQMKI